jgi:hypothetical protein
MLPLCDFHFGLVPVVYASQCNILESAVFPASFKTEPVSNPGLQGIF